MRYKNFEIRPVPESRDKNKFELVRWYNNGSCYVLAFIEYDSKSDWSINSVGMRLMEGWIDGLDKYILAWTVLKDLCMESNEDD